MTTAVLIVVYFCAAMKRPISRFPSTAGNRAGGANPDQPTSLAAATKNNRGDSGISEYEAASTGLGQTMQRRLSEGVSIDALDSKGFTALHLAIKEGHVGAVRLLLDRGADVEAPIRATIHEASA